MAGAAGSRPQATDGADARGDDPLVEVVPRSLAVVRAEGSSDIERERAVIALYGAILRWIEERGASGLAPEDRADLQAAADAMGMVPGGLRIGWLAEVSAHKLQTRWLSLLDRSGHRISTEALFTDAVLQRASLLAHLGDGAAVLERLDENTLVRIEAAGGGRVLAETLALRADTRRALGDYRGALGDIERARRLRTDAPGPEAVAVKLGIDLGRFEDVRAALARLDALARGVAPDVDPDAPVRARVAGLRYSQALGMDDAVLRGVQQVLPGAPDDMVPALQSLGAIARARLAATASETESALTDCATLGASPGIDRVAAVSLRLEALALRCRRGTDEDLSSVAQEAAMLADELAPDGAEMQLFRARALARAEHARRRLGLAPTADGALGRALEDLLAAWRALGELRGGVGFLEFADRRFVVSEAIHERLRATGDAAAALGTWLAVDGCSSMARLDGGTDRAEAAEVVALCAAHDATLVVLVGTPDQSHRFHVDRHGVTHRLVEGSAAFEPHLARVQAWIREAPVGALAPEDPAEDRAWLAERVGPARGDGPVWFAGLDLLGVAPMEVLPHRGAPYLGLVRPVTHVPSVSAILARARAPEGKERGPRDRHMVVFSPPDRDCTDGSISVTLPESAALRGAVRGARMQVTSGSAATAEGFAGFLAAGLDLFAVWAHGNYDRGLALPAGLVLTEERALRGAEVDALLASVPRELLPPVVYLAACGAGRGHLRRGDGAAAHLGGVFLVRGVDAVVVSAERNHRDATWAHLEAFAGAFLGEDTTAERAMLEARRAVAGGEGGDEDWSHPHYWAGLQVVGWGPSRAR